MFLHLKNILTPQEIHTARALLDAQDAPWVDGRLSAGGQALAHKRNEQLAQDSAQSQQLRAGATEKDFQPAVQPLQRREQFLWRPR